MPITTVGLKFMGFESIPESEKIEAYFKSLKIYQVKGLDFDKSSPLSPNLLKQISDNFSFSIGTSVNELCKTLLNDDFVDDEEKWESKNNVKPPYLMVLTQLNEVSICEQGFWQHQNNNIITHNCFSQTKQEVQEIVQKEISKLITSLTITFSSFSESIFFSCIYETVFANTNYNKYLVDKRFNILQAYGYASTRPSIEEISNQIKNADKLSQNIHDRVAYFFEIATQEKDKLKQFLYYFLAIEIHIQKLFKKEKEKLDNSSLFNFLINDKANLLDKLVWCYSLKYNQIEETDINNFKSIKECRDNISHGKIIDEESLPVERARQCKNSGLSLRN